MKNVIQIPAYKISDLNTFSPFGEWFLVSDEGEILGRFFNGDMVKAIPITPNQSEPTLVLAA